MKPRFQADADLHFEIVLGVLRREPSIDFQSAQEALEEGAGDAEILANAAVAGRILVSHDVSTMPVQFQAYMGRHNTSPGLFLIPQSTPIGRTVDDLVLIWAASDEREWINRITWLPL